MTAAIEVSDVSVSYGEVQALHDVQLRVGAGTVCALVGMNGSGKSTLFKVMMGLLRPDSGTVRLNGQSPDRARRLGVVSYVPQSESIDWSFPIDVQDVVMTGRYGRMGLSRRPRPADHAAVAAAVERVELTDLVHRQIGQLSGGQRKRAFVARGIAQGATTLLLDEPFAGVDKRSEGTIIRLLRELAADGLTILVSSHDLQALPDLADEAILLNQSVLLHATPEEVLAPEQLTRAFGLDPVRKNTVSR